MIQPHLCFHRTNAGWLPVVPIEVDLQEDNSFSVDDKYKNVVFDADTESEGIAVHRDYQIYERLKNSTMGKKLDDLSTRVSASESNFVRGGIYFTSKIGNKLSKLTTNDFNECMKWVLEYQLYHLSMGRVSRAEEILDFFGVWKP